MTMNKPIQDTLEESASLTGSGGRAPAPPGPGRRSASLVARALRSYTLVFAVVVAIAFFSALRPHIYPTLANTTSILTGNAPLVLISLGTMIPLIVNQFDLTPAYMATMSGLLVAGFQSNNHWPFWVAIVATLVVCMLAGLINGVLVAYVGLSSIIVTIGTGALLIGAAQLYSNNLIIYKGISTRFIDLGQMRFAGVPLPVIYAGVVALVIWYVLTYRPVGRHLYAVGANVEAARLVKIKVDLLVVSAFVGSAFFAALGGIVVTAQVGSASPSSLNYLLLPAFTGVFLGATSIRPGHYNVWGTVLAVYLVGSVTTGMFMLGAPPNIEQVTQGAILLLAVGLAKLSSRRSKATD